MNETEIKDLIKAISAQDLKKEAKKRGISLGRCPSKLDIAKKIPEEALKKMVKK